MRTALIAFRDLALACGLVCLTLTGCGGGDGLDRQSVYGSVTLDGTPLPMGTIRLEPLSRESGTEVSAEISNGKYSLGKDIGPVPGKYKVMISSVEDTNFKLPEGKMPGEVPTPIAKELVPPKYNVESALEMVVKPGHGEAIDFSLSSK